MTSSHNQRSAAVPQEKVERTGITKNVPTGAQLLTEKISRSSFEGTWP
jgi:hypothetical protein